MLDAVLGGLRVGVATAAAVEGEPVAGQGALIGINHFSTVDGSRRADVRHLTNHKDELRDLVVEVQLDRELLGISINTTRYLQLVGAERGVLLPLLVETHVLLGAVVRLLLWG